MYDKNIYRNHPQWHIPMELRRRLPQLPIICDPSHIGGKKELIASLSQRAMDLNFDGLMIETHIQPEQAWSDAAQQITPDILEYIMHTLVIRDTNQSTENLAQLRKQIDEYDNNLLETLAARMRVSGEIGRYKKEHNMPVLQTSRYDEILQKRVAQAGQLDMSPDFVQTIFVAIHEESVRHQMEIM
jgi:chorismate mutase